MKIISYNIQFGRGLDCRNDLSRVCRSIEGADIICLQEVETGWQRSGNVNQPEVIASLLPRFYYVYGSSFDVDDSIVNSDGKVINRRRQYGDMLLSRWPILSFRTFNLFKEHHADKFNMQMGFIESVIKTDNRALRIYNCHLGYLGVAERLAQMKQIIEVYHQSPREHGAWSGKADIDGNDWSNQKQTPHMPQSAIVCGDFNCPPGSFEYRYLLDNSNLVDSWSVSDPGNLNSSTLRHEMTEDIKISGKVDHIFVSNDLASCVKEVAIDHKAEGSDHRPVHCVVDF